MPTTHHSNSTRLLLARLMAAACAFAVAAAGAWVAVNAFEHRATAEPLTTVCTAILAAVLVRLSVVCWSAMSQVEYVELLRDAEPVRSRATPTGSRWALRLASLFLTIATGILGAGGASARSAPAPVAAVQALSAAPVPTFDALPSHPGFAPLTATSSPASPTTPDASCRDLGPGWKPADQLGCDVLLGSGQARTSAHSEPYVVKRGDTLWGIAAAHLAPDASATRIAASVQDWVRANPSLIEPNSIRVGDELHRPRVVR